MIQDITAPPITLRGQFRDSSSGQTAGLVLTRHVRLLLDDFQLSLEDTASAVREPSRPEMSPLRQLEMTSVTVLSALNQLHATYAAAARMGDLSITALRVSGHSLRNAAYVFCGTVTDVPVRTEPLKAAPPATTIERFARALSEWKGLLAPDHFDALVQHIERLLSDQEELDEDGITPSSSSFDDLLSFLSSRPWDKAPAVGLNRKGQFLVSWTRSHPYTDVTLAFLGEGSIKWYVFGLGRKGHGSAAGTSDRGDLAGILISLGCDYWMAR